MFQTHNLLRFFEARMQTAEVSIIHAKFGKGIWASHYKEKWRIGKKTPENIDESRDFLLQLAASGRSLEMTINFDPLLKNIREVVPPICLHEVVFHQTQGQIYLFILY
jgi:hypothetical protein